MSKKYIFNRKLNGHRPLWCVGIMLVLGLFTFGVVAQENMQENENTQNNIKALDVDFINPQAETQAQNLSYLSNLDFTRSSDSAIVVIKFDNGLPNVSYVEAQGKVNITFESTHINDDQFVEIDVTQFGTAVKSLETFQNENSSRLEIKYEGGVKIKKSESENEIQFSLTPLTVEEIAQAQGKTYSGKPISLDFQDVPVRQVLQIIAQVNGFNLVTTDTVSGNVTISLSGVPWDQALDMILKIRGLDKRLDGNILLIAPSEELTARETQALQSKQQVQNLADLKAANIAVNYARAEELAEILKSPDGGILSNRGTVSVDNRTNTLLLRDTQESIDEARAVIASLDIPVKQVLIESRMVTVRDNVDEQLGVRWGFTGNTSDGAVSGSLQGADIANGGTSMTIFPRVLR